VNQQLPDPLVPAEVDLTDFPFMPLDVRRLRDSDLASLESPEACWAAVLLWAASWHQVPAASLPDDDRVLSQLAGFGRVVKEWMRVREGALRGFVKCSDGRLYHPVVVEKAVEAWNGKLRLRWKRDCERIKKYHQRHKTDATYPLFEEWKAYRAETGSEQWPVVPQMSQGTLSDSPKGQQAEVPRDSGTMSPPCPPQNPVDSRQGIVDRGQGTGDRGQGEVNPKPKKTTSTTGTPNSDQPPNSSSSSKSAEAGQSQRPLSRAVFEWEKARGKVAKTFIGKSDQVAAWMAAGLTELRLREAYDLAVAQRIADSDPTPINPKFLDVFVAKVLNPKEAGSAVKVKAWHETASGIEAKGKELGIDPPSPRTGGFPAFKARVFEAAGMTTETVE
jgi:hypothetical protein